MIFPWTRKFVIKRFPTGVRHAGLESIDSMGEMRAVLSAMGGWDEHGRERSERRVSRERGDASRGRVRRQRVQSEERGQEHERGDDVVEQLGQEQHRAEPPRHTTLRLRRFDVGQPSRDSPHSHERSHASGSQERRDGTPIPSLRVNTVPPHTRQVAIAIPTTPISDAESEPPPKHPPGAYKGPEGSRRRWRRPPRRLDSLDSYAADQSEVEPDARDGARRGRWAGRRGGKEREGAAVVG